MQTKKTHWPSLLILIVLGLSVVFVLLIALGMGVSSIISLFTEDGDPAGQMISAFAFGFETGDFVGMFMVRSAKNIGT